MPRFALPIAPATPLGQRQLKHELNPSPPTCLPIAGLCGLHLQSSSQWKLRRSQGAAVRCASTAPPRLIYQFYCALAWHFGWPVVISSPDQSAPLKLPMATTNQLCLCPSLIYPTMYIMCNQSLPVGHHVVVLSLYFIFVFDVDLQSPL